MGKTVRKILSDFGLGAKLPPQAIPLEEAVLGACMIEADAVDKLDFLRPEMFYKEANVIIFTAILELKEAKHRPDILTVTEALRKAGNLETIGGAYYITQLTTRVMSAANTEYHARIIAEKFMKREMIRISGEIQTEAFDDADAFELLDKYKEELAALEPAMDGSQTFASIIDQEISDKRKEVAGEIKFRGVPTFDPELNQILGGGFENGDLVIIAAGTGMGKTSFALMVAKHVAQMGIPVLIESVEMTQRNNVRKFIVEASDVWMSKYRNNDLTLSDFLKIDSAGHGLKKLPIYIRSGACTPNKIRKDIRGFKKRGVNIGLVIADYLQIMKADEKSGSREETVASISRNCKYVAQEFDIPVIALSQINKDSQRRGGAMRPMLGSIRESAAIENDADTVIFIYRPDYHFPWGGDEKHPESRYQWDAISEVEYKATAEILIAKGRSSAPDRCVVQNWFGAVQRFSPKKPKAEDLPFSNSDLQPGHDDDLVPF